MDMTTQAMTGIEKIMLALPRELHETLNILLLEKFTEGYQQASATALKKLEGVFRDGR